MTATLEQLVKVCSQLAEGVLRYLTQLGNNLDQTNWSCGGEWIKASDIAIEPFVLTMRWRGPPLRQSPECEGPETFEEKHSPMDEIEAERYLGQMGIGLRADALITVNEQCGSIRIIEFFTSRIRIRFTLHEIRLPHRIHQRPAQAEDVVRASRVCCSAGS